METMGVAGEVDRSWACWRHGRIEQPHGSVGMFSIGMLRGKVEGLRKVRFVAEDFFRKSKYGWLKACVKSKIRVQRNLESGLQARDQQNPKEGFALIPMKQ